MTSIRRIAAMVLIALWAFVPARAADTVAATSGNVFIGSPDGRSFFHDGTWSAVAFDRDGDGGVDRVEITNTPSAGFPKPFVFHTDDPHRNITVRTYNVARPYERPGKNLLAFSLSSLPCNPYGDIMSGFTILAADFDLSGTTPVVRSFAARFAAACAGYEGPIYGYVAFNSDVLPEIATADYASSRRTLTLRGPNIALADTILIDDRPFAARHASDGSITARKAKLADGAHAVKVAVNASGYASPEFTLRTGPVETAPFARSRLKINAEPGNFVGGPGGVYRLVKGRFIMTVGDFLDDGQIDGADLSYISADGASRWYLALLPVTATRNFEIGFYPDATGMPVVEGHPGLTISGESRTCQDQIGFFTVTEYAVETTNAIDQLRWLGVRFDMRCNFNSPPLHGTLEYLATPLPVIDRIVFQSATRQLRIEVRNMSSVLNIYIDEQVFDPTAANAGELVLDRFDLLPGVHSIYVGTGDTFVSSRPIIVRG